MSLTNASPLEAAKGARLASRKLAILPPAARNDALTAIHDALSKAKNQILAANARDLEAAVKAAESGELSQSLVKRLDLSRKGKYEDMLQGILDVRGLDDPSMWLCHLCHECSLLTCAQQSVKSTNGHCLTTV
jgi:glutamate-5-semialdehyde dehydrogenase